MSRKTFEPLTSNSKLQGHRLLLFGAHWFIFQNAKIFPVPMDTLRRAQMEGELDAQTDVESLADFFESTLAGIRIAAKAGKTRPALRRIAEVASGTFADVKSEFTPRHSR